jgi:hypothetical protein
MCGGDAAVGQHSKIVFRVGIVLRLRERGDQRQY